MINPRRTGTDMHEQDKRQPLPPRWFARLALILSGTVWLAVGAFGLFDPLWLADVVDYQLTNPMARFDFRAMYGGLPMAIALLHFIASVRARWLVAALTASAVLDLGLGSARIFSLVVDDLPGPLGLTLLISELCLSGICFVALWRVGALTRAEKKAEST